MTGALEQSSDVVQYTRREITGIWAGAALPMAALAWLVAPGWRTGSTAPPPCRERFS